MAIKIRIIQLALYISDQTYAELVQNNGIEWIKKYLNSNDEQILYAVAKSPMFWAWWKNQWLIRDEQFCREISLVKQELPLDGDALKIARELYLDIHSVDAITVQPNKFVKQDIIIQLNAERNNQVSILQSLKK